MKTSLRLPALLFLCSLGMGYPQSASAQFCPLGATPTQISYDTMVVGNGNNTYNLSLPQFNPTLGTLVSARVTTMEGLRYTYTLLNGDTADHSYLTRVVRMLNVSSDALTWGDISAMRQELPFTLNIPAGGHVVRGPQYMSFTSNYMVPYEDLTNFMGGGTIGFNLVNITAASVEGPTPWNLNFSSITDTSRFSVTYTYCANMLLPLKLEHFRASRMNGSDVKVDFTVPQVNPGSTYFLERSENGKTYERALELGAIKSNNTSLIYEKAPETGFQLRIKEVTASGSVAYSTVRDVPARSVTFGVRVHPNPAKDQITVDIPSAEQGAFTVTLTGLNGQQASQYHFTGGGAKNITLPKSLTPGLYLVQTKNKSTGTGVVTKLLVN